MDAQSSKTDSAKADVILEPLNFNLKKAEMQESSQDNIICLICPEKMDNAKDFVHHMVLAHNIVIADSKLIADMKSYAEHWRKRFSEKGFAEFCTEIKFNPNFSQEEEKIGDSKCYLLCDALPEDSKLREDLQKTRLESALAQSQKEREQTDFNKPCAFCKLEIYGNRKNLIEHLAVEHQFNIGQPNNLVYVDELMDLIDEKFNKNLECLLCEKKFEDRGTLKAHVRKKQHKQLNPKNTIYDKYYLINYLEIGKNWHDVMAEDDAKLPNLNSDDEVELSDWRKEDLSAVCLFCEHVNVEGSDLMAHMKDVHGFDFKLTIQDQNLSFYHQVKLVNYIRRSMHQLRCYFCTASFETSEKLLSHLTEEKHIGCIPDTSVWDQSQYLIPTYENDNLLCKLEEPLDETTNVTSATDNLVVSEDLPTIARDSVFQDSVIRRDIASQ